MLLRGSEFYIQSPRLQSTSGTGRRLRGSRILEEAEDHRLLHSPSLHELLHLSLRTPTARRFECGHRNGDAACSKRTWLKDFEDDEITISRDLYEVILAYQHYQRPSA